MPEKRGLRREAWRLSFFRGNENETLHRASCGRSSAEGPSRHHGRVLVCGVLRASDPAATRVDSRGTAEVDTGPGK